MPLDFKNDAFIYATIEVVSLDAPQGGLSYENPKLT
jgi:hypothetical protein